jgi:hypothetical protein
MGWEGVKGAAKKTGRYISGSVNEEKIRRKKKRGGGAGGKLEKELFS